MSDNLSASAKQKPVHCSDLFVTQLAIRMPTWTITQYSACQQASERVNETTRQEHQAPGSSKRLEHHARSDQLLQKILPVKRKFIFVQILTDRNTSGSSTILQKNEAQNEEQHEFVQSRIEAVFVHDVVKIQPIFKMSRSTLRFGTSIRASAFGAHLGYVGSRRLLRDGDETIFPQHEFV